jgi:hypothetical protein
MVRKPVLAN